MVTHICSFKYKILTTSTFVFVVLAGYAQSSYPETGEIWLQDKDSIHAIDHSSDVEDPLHLLQFEPSFAHNRAIGIRMPDEARHMEPDLLGRVMMVQSPYVSKSANSWGLPFLKHSTFTVSYNESAYKNLMDRQTVVFASDYQWNYLQMGIRFIATRYETTYSTNQFGVSGFLEYNFSPSWSIYAWGTLYNNTPYYSMAAFPFVETSSYGVWVKCEGKKAGIKLGARRFYDTLQRKWKTEPIITPTIHLGRKVVLELPVGPFVQKSIKMALRKRLDSGPAIMHDFQL